MEPFFTNTFPIGNVVASHDSTSLPLVTLRRCPSRLYDVACLEILSKKHEVSVQRSTKTSNRKMTFLLIYYMCNFKIESFQMIFFDDSI